MKKAENKILTELRAGDRIGLALSGGSDSMALLHLLRSLQQKADFYLCAVHVNHGIRGAESDGEEDFVTRFCAEAGVECIAERADAKGRAERERIGLEAAARAERYRIFLETAERKKLRLICLAHHQSDQAETVLHHILRGSGAAGARGMETLRGGLYFRPMLDTPKKAVTAYVRKNKIPYMTDSSNKAIEFDRNFLRLKIFPLLNTRWSAEANIAAFADNARSDDDYINAYVPKVTAVRGEVHLKTELLGSHYAIASRYVLAGAKALGIAQDFTKENIRDILSLKDKQSGRRVTLKGGYSAVREYGDIIINGEESGTAVYTEVAFSGAGLYPLPGATVRVSEAAARGGARGAVYVDASAIPAGAVFRFRREGDIFEKFGGGRRKLKEYFIDCKIPKRERDSIPLLAKDENILAVCGKEIAETLKITDNTKKIFCLQIL